jgi:hypothetical protein
MVTYGEVERFLGRPYKYENGPATPVEQVETEGGNCQRLGHDAYRAWYAVQFPSGLWSKELFTDETHYVQTVAADDESKPGDIYLFGRATLKDPKSLHWAIYIGVDNKTGEELFLHANVVDGQTTIWPLSRFAEHERYETLYARKRLQPEMYDVFVARQNPIELVA